MARGKLFEAWTFKLSLPAPFDDPKFSGMHDFGLSQYNTAARLRKATLHASVSACAFRLCKACACDGAGFNDRWDGRDRAPGKHIPHLGVLLGEQDGLRGIQYNNGKFIASQFEDGSDVPKPYTIGAGNGSGTALFFCLMPILEEDTEFQCSFATFKDHMANGWSIWMARLSVPCACAITSIDALSRRHRLVRQV